MSKSRWTIAAVLATGFLSTAWAVDGVILIDQNRALAGNVTPGDGAGFPITISQPGSYRLTSNLNVPSGFNGIEITSPNVTIDLNGFLVSTPDPISFPPFYFGIHYSGAAIPKYITIRNGNIDGFVVPIQLIANVKCQYCTFTDLITRVPVGASSWDLGNWTRVQNVTAINSSLNVICPSLVTNTVARDISKSFPFPGDPNPASVGSCTFGNNSTTF
jgi:hypothetical protein